MQAYLARGLLGFGVRGVRDGLRLRSGSGQCLLRGCQGPHGTLMAQLLCVELAVEFRVPPLELLYLVLKLMPLRLEAISLLCQAVSLQLGVSQLCPQGLGLGFQ